MPSVKLRRGSMRVKKCSTEAVKTKCFSLPPEARRKSYGSRSQLENLFQRLKATFNTVKTIFQNWDPSTTGGEKPKKMPPSCFTWHLSPNDVMLPLLILSYTSWLHLETPRATKHKSVHVELLAPCSMQNTSFYHGTFSIFRERVIRFFFWWHIWIQGEKTRNNIFSIFQKHHFIFFMKILQC